MRELLEDVQKRAKDNTLKSSTIGAHLLQIKDPVTGVNLIKGILELLDLEYRSAGR